MARLVIVTAWSEDSTVYPSASPMALNADLFKSVRNASLQLKQSIPSASGVINSQIQLNSQDNNEGTNHTYLVQETIATIVTASA